MTPAGGVTDTLYMTTATPTTVTTIDPHTAAMLRQRYSAAYQAGRDSVANTTMRDDEVDRLLAWSIADLDNDHLRPYECQQVDARASAAFWLGSVEGREALAR